MKTRTIKQIIASNLVDMGGIHLQQPLPNRTLDQIDPFLLIHHGALPVKKGKPQNKSGVGPHPHRGFSPVTFVFKGSIHHRDSLGNSALVKGGGTQWIHSGKGIIHSERPGKDIIETGGDNEIIQFWVNTPAKHKMEEPYYLPISEESTPTVVKGNSVINVVAGQFEGTQGPAKTYSPQTLLRVEAKANDSFTMEINKSFNTLIYILDGSLEIDGQKANDKDMVWFENDGDAIALKVCADTRFIVLSGEPIGEKISTYGPFVMNTQQEIQEALYDYQSGKMGELIEVFD